MLQKSDQMQLWLAERKVSSALILFRFRAEYGREESSIFLGSFCMRALDIKDVDGGPQFMESIWFFGVMPGSTKFRSPKIALPPRRRPGCGLSTFSRSWTAWQTRSSAAMWPRRTP